RIDRVPTQSLKWLASVDPTKPVGQPFSVKEKEKTWEFYSGRFQRYLCYCVRVFPLGRRTAQRTHRVRFTSKQWQGLAAVVQRLKVLADKRTAAGRPVAAAEEQDPDEAALDRAVFAFCISSLKQKIRRRVYENPLLHFTSVLAIGPTKALWVPAHSFTRSLAGILWCSRVLMLEDSFAPYDKVGIEDSSSNDGSSNDGSSCDGDGGDHDSSDSGSNPDAESGGDETDEEVAEEVIENFARGYREWLCDGAETLLNGLLAGTWAQIRPTIVLGDIIDSLVYEGPGRSFATNSKNRWLQAGVGKMAELVGPRLFRAVKTQGGRTTYKCRRQAAEEFILHLKRFKSTMLAAVHIWGGQPGRGPEMTTLKHCDTEELPRNVFVFDGLVVLITDHDKQRKGRRVARWLPEDVSRIMVAYVAWLVPFELGRRIKGLVVRQAEMDATSGGNECEERVDPQTGEVRQQPAVDYIWDLQATHGSRIAASHYAL
ncbi:hypothetical protein QBC34DRAFT_432084, partial [Podospora aff. communis PSN243]